MNWLDRARLSLARTLYKAESISLIPEWVRYSVFHPSWQALLSEGYKANSAIFACVSALAFGFQEPPLTVWSGEGRDLEPVRRHPIRKLMRRPNPDMGEAEFHQVCIVYCAIGGNVYIWKQRSKGGQVVGLWPFHDGQIAPIPGTNTSQGFVAGYELDVDGRKHFIPKQDIIHWKWMPDPGQPSRGIGAIAAAARDVDTDNEVGSYVFSLLKNNAVPPVVITLVEGDELTEPKAKRLRSQWMQNQGGGNRGGIAFLEAGMKAEKMGFDLAQLAFEALRSVPEARVAANFRVPPIIAGLNIGLNRSTFSNYGEARRSFTEDTLVRLWRSFGSEMEAGLAQDFGDDLILQHDLSEVRALQENEGEIWTRADNGVNNGYLKRSEARQMVGLKSGPEDEVYKESLTMVWVPAGEQRPQPSANGNGTEPSDEADEMDPGDGQKGQRRPQHKARVSRRRREELQKVVDALRSVRLMAAGRMEAAVDGHFQALADTLVGRARDVAGKAESKKLSRDEWTRLTRLLFLQDDVLALENLVKRHYLQVMLNSSGVLDLALSTATVFDADDPAVARILEGASRRVKEISDTTRDQINALLQFGSDNGWSIDDLVNGDPAGQPRGLRALVAESYRGRARTIARTELGTAQQLAAVGRYKAAGVKQVLVFDNGLTDDDEPCQAANGAVWSLEEAEANPLEHPNCTRAFAPLFN